MHSLLNSWLVEWSSSSWETHLGARLDFGGDLIIKCDMKVSVSGDLCCVGAFEKLHGLKVAKQSSVFGGGFFITFPVLSNLECVINWCISLLS